MDIDGTIRTSQKQITERTKKAIKHITEQGILTILCSGRPKNFTENVSQECLASPYIIISNGGSIYDLTNNEAIYHNAMNEQACHQIYQIAQTFHTGLIINSGDKRVVNDINKFENAKEILLTEPIESYTQKYPVLQCSFVDTDQEKIDQIAKRVKNIPGIHLTTPKGSIIEGKIYLDACHEATSKGNAIKQFCQMKNISREETIAIGDDYNDLTMFQEVEYSVAMGNSPEEVKQMADEVTKTNDEEGVAYFLEKLSLSGLQLK